MITVTGSLAFDYIMDYPGVFAEHIMPDKIHQLNLSFLVNTLNKQKGGTAGNIAYNLALLKLPVSIVGTAGNDFSEYAKFLKENGVNTSGIKIIPDEPTSSAFITTDQKDNQIAAFYPGAMSQVHTVSLTSLTPKPDFSVISPNPPEAMVKFAEECRQLKIPYMFDPGMILPRLTNEQLLTGLKGATILIGNDYEMSLLKQKLSLTDQQLLEYVQILITTLGEKGSIIQTKNGNTVPTSGVGLPAGRQGFDSPEVFLPGRWEIKPAKPKEVLDPTGAGDAYRSGFMAGYTKGFDLKTCGQMGGVASCYAIEKYGTTSHKFTIEEFCERYKENFEEELNLG